MMPKHRQSPGFRSKSVSVESAGLGSSLPLIRNPAGSQAPVVTVKPRAGESWHHVAREPYSTNEAATAGQLAAGPPHAANWGGWSPSPWGLHRIGERCGQSLVFHPTRLSGWAAVADWDSRWSLGTPLALLAYC